MKRKRRDRRKELQREIRKARGYTYPEWELAAELDPDFMTAYNQLYRKSLGEGRGLPLKYKEFVVMAILAFRGETNSVYLHMKRALEFGATHQEVLEAFEAALIPGGALTFLHGLRALRRIREEKGG